MSKTTKFNVYPYVSVSTTDPVYKKDRASITIVIDYPDYHHNDFTGYFEINVLDVEDFNEKGKSLYFDTMRAEWEDNDDWRNPDKPFEFKMSVVEGNKHE
jgi:hypothetical protein